MKVKWTKLNEKGRKVDRNSGYTYLGKLGNSNRIGSNGKFHSVYSLVVIRNRWIILLKKFHVNANFFASLVMTTLSLLWFFTKWKFQNISGTQAAMLSRCHAATLPHCHGATVPRCHAATLPPGSRNWQLINHNVTNALYKMWTIFWILTFSVT